MSPDYSLPTPGLRLTASPEYSLATPGLRRTSTRAYSLPAPGLFRTPSPEYSLPTILVEELELERVELSVVRPPELPSSVGRGRVSAGIAAPASAD